MQLGNHDKNWHWSNADGTILLLSVALLKLTSGAFKAMAVAGHCSLALLAYDMALDTLQMHLRHASGLFSHVETSSNIQDKMYA